MKLIFVSICLFISSLAFGKSFDEIWSSFYSNSLHQKAISDERIATDLSLKRSRRHWLPRAFVSAQWFRTDDPGQVFFNQLGQRSITQADFNPSTLNSPARETFRMGAVGVDLPLFEGGMKVAQVSHFEKLVLASELEEKAKQSEEYADLARRYGNVFLLSQSSDKLKKLKEGLEAVISRYQVGEQSNPVGHSGLLGLKGVLNRIDGLLTEFDLKSQQEKNWISEKAKIPDNWSPDSQMPFDQFLISTLVGNSQALFSSMIVSQEKKLEAMSEMIKMERARYLPRLGVFGQSNLYQGNRDTASSQSIGLYLMWDLFNPDSFGREGEASAKVLAQEAKLRAHKQEETIALKQLMQSERALEKVLRILQDSDELLGKQAQLSMRLFRSGMLNALQLSEVINRRVDLVDSKQKAQASYLDVKSRLYQITH